MDEVLSGCDSGEELDSHQSCGVTDHLTNRSPDWGGGSLTWREGQHSYYDHRGEQLWLVQVKEGVRATRMRGGGAVACC